MRRRRSFALAMLAVLASPSWLGAQGWTERLGLDRLGALHRPIVVWGELGVLEHRVTLGGELEQATGPVAGLSAEGAVTSWLDLRASVRGGTLDADWSPAEDRRLGELALVAEALPVSWIAVIGGVSTRVYRTEFGRQRWTRLTIGPELRTPLHDRIAGHVRIAASPYVSVTDTRSPARALEGEAGVSYESDRLRLALTYSLERYGFEPANGGRRLEQLGGLTAGIGWRLGR